MAKAKKKVKSAGRAKARLKAAAASAPVIKLGRLSGTKRTEQVRQFVRAAAKSFVSIRNVTSMGIDYKTSHGQPTGELAIRFTVVSKVPPEAVAGVGSQLLPRSIQIDGMTVPTDVVECRYWPSYMTRPLRAKDTRKTRMATIQPGASVSNAAMFDAGSLGTYVRESETREVVMLSNWHVFDGDYGGIGSDIVQPGTLDDNRTNRNLCGRLLRSYIGPAGDCAIASINDRPFSSSILDIGFPVRSIGDPQEGDLVVKSGRTTGLTYGIVRSPDVNAEMTYSRGRTVIVGGFEIVPDPARPESFNRSFEDQKSAPDPTGRGRRPGRQRKVSKRLKHVTSDAAAGRRYVVQNLSCVRSRDAADCAWRGSPCTRADCSSTLCIVRAPDRRSLQQAPWRRGRIHCRIPRSADTRVQSDA